MINSESSAYRQIENKSRIQLINYDRNTIFIKGLKIKYIFIYK